MRLQKKKLQYQIPGTGAAMGHTMYVRPDPIPGRRPRGVRAVNAIENSLAATTWVPPPSRVGYLLSRWRGPATPPAYLPSEAVKIYCTCIVG